MELDVQVLDRGGNPAPGATILARDPESKEMFISKTDGRGRAVVKTPVDGAVIVTIYGGEIHTQEINIKVDVPDHYRDFRWKKIEKMRKIPRHLDIRLP